MRTILLFFLLFGCGAAHELQDNRATLVLRDKTHVSVTMYVAFVEALHQALAPQRPFPAFLLVYSAMKPEDLQRELQRAQTKFQSSTKLYVSGGAEIGLANWTWPDLNQVQDLLQQRAMQVLVDPGSHTHGAPVEIHAEATAPLEVNTVRVQFPDEFDKVLVVAYRPNQLWVERKALSPAIRF